MGLKEDLRNGVGEDGLYLAYFKADLVKPFLAFTYRSHREPSSNDPMGRSSGYLCIGQESLETPSGDEWEVFWGKVIEGCVVMKAPSYTGRVD